MIILFKLNYSYAAMRNIWTISQTVSSSQTRSNTEDQSHENYHCEKRPFSDYQAPPGWHINVLINLSRKRALHYDDETNRNHTRRYSYKGEVVSCQNSKISTKIHPNTSTFNHKPKPKNGENHNNDYYAKDSQEESRTKIPVRE